MLVLEFLLTLIGLCLAVSLAAGGVFFYALRRDGKGVAQSRRQASELAALFKTMRDIVSQQKEMAREFNEELDKKVTIVKQILTQSVEKNERIYEEQQRIRKELRETREELHSLQRQTAHLKSESPAPPVKGEMPPAMQTAGFVEWLKHPGAAEVTSTTDSTPASETPEDTVAGTAEDHNAFRALLDLQPLPPELSSTPEVSATGTAGGNGGRGITPVQKRVLEYSQAGMPVPEIARELGIGKGEVRLMLSLLKQKRT